MLLKSPTQKSATDEMESGIGIGDSAVRHCRSCWRNDIHHPVLMSPTMLGFLIVATLGLIILTRPSRCTCCGNLRIF